MEPLSLIQHGILRYIEVEGATPVETLMMLEGFDSIALNLLIGDDLLSRSEADIIFLAGQSDIELKILFKAFVKIYPGVKRGVDTELADFKKKHKAWRKLSVQLKPNLLRQMGEREAKIVHISSLERAGNRNHGLMVAPWKNLKTYLNQSCWTEEIFQVVSSPDLVVDQGPVYTLYLERCLGVFGLTKLTPEDKIYILSPEQFKEWITGTGPFDGLLAQYSLPAASDFLWKAHKDFYNIKQFKFRNLYGYLSEQFKLAKKD